MSSFILLAFRLIFQSSASPSTTSSALPTRVLSSAPLNPVFISVSQAELGRLASQSISLRSIHLTSFPSPRPVSIDEDVPTTVAVSTPSSSEPTDGSWSDYRHASRKSIQFITTRVTDLSCFPPPRLRCRQCAVRRRRRRRPAVSSRSSICRSVMTLKPFASLLLTLLLQERLKSSIMKYIDALRGADRAMG